MFGTTGPIATNKLMYKSLPYDPEKDLTPVVLVAKSPLIVVAHPSFPAKDLKELIDYAKANPDKVNAGNPGNGTLGHITSELLQQHTGTKMIHVPYRGTRTAHDRPARRAAQRRLRFHDDLYPAGERRKAACACGHVGRESCALPNVMTVQEAGFTGFEATAWYAIVAPTGTPADVIEKVNTITNDYLNSPKGKAQLDTFAMQAAGGTPDDLQGLHQERAREVGPDHQGGEHLDVTAS